MTEELMESIITGLVVGGGDARSKALSAIQKAKINEMEAAEELLQECNQALTEAHNLQTSLIQEALNGEQINSVNGGLLMVHGQDHLMDAMVVRDLAKEMIDLYKLIYTLKSEQ